MNNKPLTTTAVAERLGVSIRTLERWINQGKFPNVQRLDKGLRSPFIIPEGDVIAFENTRKPKQEE